MRDDLSKRILTSIILAFILIACLFISNYSWLFLLIIVSIICYFEFNYLAKKIWKKKLSYIYLSNIISCFYLIFFTYSAYEVAKINVENILFVLLICIFSDTGGYFIGKLIGGKKLNKISPNKTISGSLGSFVFSLVPFIFLLIFKEISDRNIIQLFFITMILSFICQSGDLFISYFKRKANVKDTGSVLPGHGGLLDRIDGIIFAIPVAYFLYKLLF